MENNKKCSSKKHKDINAISYCQECNIFMCNKCINHHEEIFDFHHKYNLNEQDINDFFSGLCKETNHNIKLNYYCKNHNQLCCAACLSKIKDKEYGKHSDCNVCLIKEIENEKKNKLKKNIKNLEKYSINFEKAINELKKLFEKINKTKEELKMKISKIFTQIRNEINDREDKLLLEVDNKFDDLYFKEEIIHKNENLPNKIKKNLEKGKLLEKEWNNNKLNVLINECISIENNIQNIKEINNTIEKCLSNKTKVIFLPENNINDFLEKIRLFGQINIKNNNNKLDFQFKPGENYTLSNNGLIATKTKGGDNWNCTIIGNKEIPKNEISKWKIKINNFEIKENSWNILIGLGPENLINEEIAPIKCWSFICGENQLCIQSENETRYNDKEPKTLNKGDIIEVIVDRKLGNLSFSVNGENYGIACSEIPKEETLYPVVMINDQDQIVEIVDS